MVARNVVMMMALCIFTDTAMYCKKMQGQHGGQQCNHDEGINCFHTDSDILQENLIPT